MNSSKLLQNGDYCTDLRPDELSFIVECNTSSSVSKDIKSYPNGIMFYNGDFIPFDNELKKEQLFNYVFLTRGINKFGRQNQKDLVNLLIDEIELFYSYRSQSVSKCPIAHLKLKNRHLDRMKRNMKFQLDIILKEPALKYLYEVMKNSLKFN